MSKESRATDIGPLFADELVANQEPAVIWDDNNDDPADEQQWLKWFATNNADISASEAEFVAEYDRRRAR
jgi:hypothetical protein